ncbi:hypothetical protein FVE85_4630 [Porphyridium purpureum]|uniref:GRIP domain-containing protein n=1 Tax=Porphyridium purpureum TaxID=35688 RepID=A0A5J4YRS8_PORPP|nr:hypothetical protein FVE85_4630 [Porphyridium purpureum]|eukprot:POR8034..scf236_6
MWNRLQSLKEQANEAARKVEQQGRAVAARAQQAIAEAALEDDHEDSKDETGSARPREELLDGLAEDGDDTSLWAGETKPHADDRALRSEGNRSSADSIVDLQDTGSPIQSRDGRPAHSAETEICAQNHARSDVKTTPNLSQGKQRAAQLFRSFLGQDESEPEDEDEDAQDSRITENEQKSTRQNAEHGMTELHRELEEYRQRQNAMMAELQWYREELQKAQARLQSADEEQAAITGQFTGILHSREQESEKLRQEVQSLGLRLAEAESKADFAEQQLKVKDEMGSDRIQALEGELAQVREQLSLALPANDVKASEEGGVRHAAEELENLRLEQTAQSLLNREHESTIAALEKDKAEMQAVLDRLERQKRSSPRPDVEDQDVLLERMAASEAKVKGHDSPSEPFQAVREAEPADFAVHAELDKALKRIETLEEANAQIQADRVEAMTQANDLRERNEALMLELHTVETDKKDGIASLEVELAECKSMIEELTSKGQDAEMKNNEHQKMVSSLAQEKHVLERALCDQKTVVESERERLVEVEARLFETETIRSRMEAELEEAGQNSAVLRSELMNGAQRTQHLETKNARLDDEVASLKVRLEEMQDAFEKQRSTLLSQLSELEHELQKRGHLEQTPVEFPVPGESDATKYAAMHHALCNRIVDCLREIDDDARTACFNPDLVGSATAGREMRDEVDLESLVETLLDEARAQRVKVAQLLLVSETKAPSDEGGHDRARTVETGTAEVSASVEELESLRRALDANSSERDAALARSLNYEFRIEELESELNSLKQERTEEAENHEAVLRELEEDLEQTGARLVRERDARQRMEAECSRLSKDYDALSEQYHLVSNDLSRKSLLFAEQEEKMIALEHECLSAQDEVEHLRDAIRGTHAVNASRLESEIGRLEYELSKSRARVTEVELAQRKLSDQLQQATDDLARAHAEIAARVESELNLQQVLEQFQVEQEAQQEIASSDVKRQLKAETQRVSELQEEIALKTRMINRSVQELEKKDNAIIDLRTRVELLTDAHVQLKSELEKSLARIYETETQNELVDRRVVRQLIVNYFQVEPRRRHDVLELMTRVLEFSPEEQAAVGLNQSQLGRMFSKLVRAPTAGAVRTQQDVLERPIGNVSDKWIEFLMKETEPGQGDDF